MPPKEDSNKKDSLEFQDDTVQALLAKARREAEMRAHQASVNNNVLPNIPPGTRGELAGTKPVEEVTFTSVPVEKEHAPIQPAPEQTPPTNNPLLKNLRTYQGDIAEALKNQNATSASIALAERKRASERPIVPQTPVQKQREKKNTWLAFGSAAFLVVGLAILGGLYYIHVENLPVPVATPPKTIVSFDKETEILIQGLTRDKFMSVVYDIKDKVNMPTGQIQYLHIIKRVGATPEQKVSQDITATDFFNLIKTKAPQSFTKSLAKTFMLGIYQGKQPDVFMLVGLTNYENAFDGIFRWEDFMWDELGALLSPITHATQTYTPIVAAVATTTATSTSATTTQPRATSTLDTNKVVSTPVASLITNVNEKFIDKIISNKDARILQDEFGQSVLVYGFVTKNLLLIASSEEAFKALLDRVFATQAQ